MVHDFILVFCRYHRVRPESLPLLLSSLAARVLQFGLRPSRYVVRSERGKPGLCPQHRFVYVDWTINGSVAVIVVVLYACVVFTVRKARIVSCAWAQQKSVQRRLRS